MMCRCAARWKGCSIRWGWTRTPTQRRATFWPRAWQINRGIVIDIRLPDMNGLDFQAQLIDIGVRLPVVMMTGYGDITMSVRAMKRGAIDFLPKPFHDQDMLDAVMAALERDRERRTVEGDISQLRQRCGTLSARELQVMQLVTAGKMNKQVANDLGISEITVKIHRGAAMRKMGAKTLADLVRMAEAVKPKG